MLSLLLLASSECASLGRLWICTGGACTRGGGAAALSLAHCLAHGSATVAGDSCCSVCPKAGFVAKDSVKNAQMTIPSVKDDVSENIRIVSNLLQDISGNRPSEMLVAAWRNRTAGLGYLNERKYGDSIACFDSAIQLAYLTVLSSKDDSFEQPLPLSVTLVEWEGSTWVLNHDGDELTLGD